MKKICCMFLICLMVFSNFSERSFAADVPNIKDLSEKNIYSLKVNVNDTFYNIVELKREDISRAVLLDSICCSNLLASYYNICNQKNLVKEYLAKMYVIQGELVLCSLKDNFRLLKLALFFFKQAIYFFETSDKQELCEKIKYMLIDIKQDVLSFIEESKQYYSLDENKVSIDDYLKGPNNIMDVINLIDNTKDLYFESDNILYGSKLLIDENSESLNSIPFENDSDVYDECLYNSDECKCSLKLDPWKTYSVREVVCNILKGNFIFGENQTHIALGLFKHD